MQNTLRALQRQLERFYELEQAPDIVEFVRLGETGMRETVLVRQDGEGLELAVVLPAALEHHSEASRAGDAWFQLVEAVSHFVYIAERARTDLPATQAELELQAEVDKFVVSALTGQALTREHTLALHGDLYERIRYLHAADSEAGARYRLANDLAARFMARLMNEPGARVRHGTLRRFYRSGQAEKIRLARAA